MEWMGGQKETTIPVADADLLEIESHNMGYHVAGEEQ